MQAQSSDEQWQQMVTRVKGTSQTLFQKLSISLDDNTIKQDQQLQNSKPIYHVEDPQQQQTQALSQIQVQQGQQALYDPFQDDKNQKWLNKKLQRQMVPEEDLSRPLVCPGCFNQVAFSYDVCFEEEGRVSYRARKLYSVVVDESKVLRAKGKQTGIAIQMHNLDQAQKQLKQSQQNFNVKIMCFCTCGVEVGWYDVHREHYALFNVI